LFISILLQSTSSGTLTSETYQNARAGIEAPDTIFSDEDFEIGVNGELVGDSAWGLYRYALYENAQWYYDSNHRAIITSYDKIIEISGYNWGFTFSKTYIQNKTAGDYSYTFIFNDMRQIHNYYSVVVDLEITVQRTYSTPCDIGRYIQTLPDEDFKNDNENLKIALKNKLCVVGKMLAEEFYFAAKQKLEHDIRDKIDKWVEREDTRIELLDMIDRLLRDIAR
jgi:hypothetical protein